MHGAGGARRSSVLLVPVRRVQAVFLSTDRPRAVPLVTLPEQSAPAPGTSGVSPSLDCISAARPDLLKVGFVEISDSELRASSPHR